MDEVFLTVFAMSVTVLSAAFVLWKWLEGTHREKMAIIEKGINPLEGIRHPGHPLSVLKWALLLTLVGIGLVTGIILSTNFHVVEEVTPVLGLIGGGIALLIYYGIAAKKLG